MKKAEMREEIERLKRKVEWTEFLVNNEKGWSKRYKQRIAELETDLAANAVTSGCIPPGAKTEAPHSTVHIAGDGLGLSSIGGKTNPLFTNAPMEFSGIASATCHVCQGWEVTAPPEDKYDGDIITCQGCGKKWAAVIRRMAPIDGFQPDVFKVTAEQVLFHFDPKPDGIAPVGGIRTDKPLTGIHVKWPAEDE